MEASDRERKIQTWWNPEWTKNGICLCVTGSVARKEETAHSDLDMLLLHKADSLSTQLIEEIIPLLHSRITNVSIVARSLEECSLDVLDDLRSFTALMDAEFLTGSESVFIRFREQLRDQLDEKRSDMLCWIRKMTDARHTQYGETIALLEPNIKNSAGALRDIHTMCYIAVSQRMIDLPRSGNRRPAMSEILRTLPVQERRMQEVLSAYTFLLTVRQTMHQESGHLHDTLDFDLQRSVAEAMGYGDRAEKHPVESFMRHYYQYARTVHVSLELILHDAEKQKRQGTPHHARQNIFPETDGAKTITATDIVESFLEACRNGESVSIEGIRLLDMYPTLDFTVPEVRKTFDRILREQWNVAPTLARMHELRILGKIIPEFSLLNTFFQHNIYHYFTVDEHTLRSIGACEMLKDSVSHVARVLHQIPDVSVLYYALLLHDIAKPIDVSRHEEIGADLVRDILPRFGRQEIVADVSFLVRHHLLLEQLAFRRNVREAATIRPFAELIGTVHRLNLLYVLTYADMSALNPRILTGWKTELLAELYQITRHYLDTGTIPEIISERESSVEPIVHMSQHEYRTAIQDILDGELMRIHVSHQRAFSEVTVFCVDRPELLSQLSAAFFAADTTIVDATIETRNDVVIDVFRVVDIVSGKHLSSEQTRKLKQLIRRVCSGDLPSEELYRRFRRKWIRKLRNMPHEHVRTAVEYLPHTTDSGSQQTIIEVYAPDTFGLLYRLSGEISRFGLNVVFAKIATRIDGVVDSFYVVDSEGNPFSDGRRQKELRERLLSNIAQLTQ